MRSNFTSDLYIYVYITPATLPVHLHSLALKFTYLLQHSNVYVTDHGYTKPGNSSGADAVMDYRCIKRQMNRRRS